MPVHARDGTGRFTKVGRGPKQLVGGGCIYNYIDDKWEPTSGGNQNRSHKEVQLMNYLNLKPGWGHSTENVVATAMFLRNHTFKGGLLINLQKSRALLIEIIRERDSEAKIYSNAQLSDYHKHRGVYLEKSKGGLNPMHTILSLADDLNNTHPWVYNMSESQITCELNIRHERAMAEWLLYSGRGTFIPKPARHILSDRGALIRTLRQKRHEGLRNKKNHRERVIECVAQYFLNNRTLTEGMKNPIYPDVKKYCTHAIILDAQKELLIKLETHIEGEYLLEGKYLYHHPDHLATKTIEPAFVTRQYILKDAPPILNPATYNPDLRHWDHLGLGRRNNLIYLNRKWDGSTWVVVLDHKGNPALVQADQLPMTWTNQA